MYQNPSDQRYDSDAGGRARVLVVGVGALGCPAASALVHVRGALDLITLVDPDRVELSNLHRQPLFNEDDIGRLKAEVAASRLTVTGTCRVETRTERLDADNAERLIGAHDYVVDATDCPETKFLINDVAVRLGVAFSYAGVVRTGGQTMAVVPGESACLRCVFPEGADTDGGACSDMGILAPVAGVIGTLQAAHALGHLAGRPIEAGCMTIYELRGQRFRRVTFPRRARCCACAQGAPSSHSNVSSNKTLRQRSHAASQTQPRSATPDGDTDVDTAAAHPRRQPTCHS